MSRWPFGSLTPLKYGGLLLDPPWSYEMYGASGYGKAPEAHYETMCDDDIAALPIGHLASGDCLVWCWVTWPKLPSALRCFSAWGVAYKTGGSWTKTTRSGKRAFGTGYILRSATEPFILGTIGAPRIGSRSIRNLIESPRRAHSQKPDEARQMLAQLRPESFCADLFSGPEPWPGHDTWNPKQHRRDDV
nr:MULTISPECIES: MT-A70 family methyltransferase [unclassified Xanthobacter]